MACGLIESLHTGEGRLHCAPESMKSWRRWDAWCAGGRWPRHPASTVRSALHVATLELYSRGLAGLPAARAPATAAARRHRHQGKDQRTHVSDPIPAPALHAKDRHHTGYASGEQRHADKSLGLGFLGRYQRPIPGMEDVSTTLRSAAGTWIVCILLHIIAIVAGQLVARRDVA